MARLIYTYCNICRHEHRRWVDTRFGESESLIRETVAGCRNCQEPAPGSALDQKITELAKEETRKNTLKYMRDQIAARRAESEREQRVQEPQRKQKQQQEVDLDDIDTWVLDDHSRELLREWRENNKNVQFQPPQPPPPPPVVQQPQPQQQPEELSKELQAIVAAIYALAEQVQDTQEPQLVNEPQSNVSVVKTVTQPSPVKHVNNYSSQHETDDEWGIGDYAVVAVFTMLVIVAGIFAYGYISSLF